MCIVNIFLVLTAILSLLFIWFKTTAFYDYCCLFGLKFLFKNFDKHPNISFPQYLFLNKEKISNNKQYLIFLLKLISCPICTNFWLCVCGAILLQNVFMVFPLYILTLLIYGILSKFYPG